MTENVIRVLQVRKIVPVCLIGVIDIEQEVACTPLGLELNRVVMSTPIVGRTQAAPVPHGGVQSAESYELHHAHPDI